MKAISLFSGIGGFDLGFERAGIETVLQVEQDKHALRVLERHWPSVRRMTDVRDVRDGAADLIFGGFPCQDLSVAGKRAGLGGERSGLWFEFHRIVRELRPRWVVIENVPGLLSSHKGRDFAVLLDGLDELGFAVSWAVLDAQYFGVPQRRRRVFIIGGPSRRSAEQVLSLCEGCGGNPAAGGAPGEEVAEPPGGSARSGGFRTTDPDNSGAFVVGALDTEVGGGRLTHQTVANGHLIGTMTARMFNALGARDVEEGAIQATREGVRRLTPLECERLQGFPDGWTEGQADSHRYRQLGNAVAVPVAEWIGHRLMEVAP